MLSHNATTTTGPVRFSAMTSSRNIPRSCSQSSCGSSIEKRLLPHRPEASLQFAKP